MRITSTPRRGIALVTAILAILVIGALVTGIFFASNQNYKAGRNALYQERALTAAEFGQNAVLRDWNVDTAFLMAVGATRSRTVNVQNRANAEVTWTKLNRLTFWVVSEGRTEVGTDREARRRTGMIVRLDVPDIPARGALNLRSAAVDTIGGNGGVSGTDANPGGWTDCPPAGPEGPGIVQSDMTKMATKGANCSGYNCVSGTPQRAADPTMADTAEFFTFGGINWADLTAMANVIMPAGTVTTSGGTTIVGPRVSGTACDKTNIYNWGDPTRLGPCANYFPIIWARGNLTINGGQGQGILIVDGDLSVAAGGTFYGPVLVRGRLASSGTGAHFVGGVMVANQNGVPSTILGGGTFKFSRCAMITALAAHAKPTVPTRSWADMY
jgi:hypothetical protein